MTPGMIADRRHYMVSDQTVVNRLREVGLRRRRAARKPYLSQNNIRDTLQFAERHRNWPIAAWRHVIFSDEVCVSSDPNGQIYV